MKIVFFSAVLISISYIGDIRGDDSSFPQTQLSKDGSSNATRSIIRVEPPMEGSDVTRSNIRGRIVNGFLASSGQFPYATRLVISNGQGSGAVCGGTIVSSHLVITAAHCFGIVDSIDLWYGSIDKDNFPHHRSGIAYAKHPLYQTPGTLNLEHDIAIIYMNKAVQVKFAKLPTHPSSADAFNGLSLTAAGWGVTETGDGSRYLKYTTIMGEPLGIIGRGGNANFICGRGVSNSQLGSGDSGGPLMHGDTLVGVNSFGRGDHSGYTCVDQYLDWIANADMKCI